MMPWLRHQGQALRHALGFIFHHPVSHFLALWLLALLVSLTLCTGYAWQRLTLWAHQTLPEPHLTLFMAEGASETQIHGLWDALAANPEVRAFDYISPDDALKSLQRMPELRGALSILDHNPLPPTFIIHARSPNVAHLDELQQTLAHSTGVAQVRSDRLWAQRLDKLLALGEGLMGILTLFFSGCALTLVYFLARHQASNHLRTNQVFHFLGATPRYRRRPFWYYGIILGLISSTLGWGLLLWGLTLYNPFAAVLGQLLQLSLNLPAPDFDQGIELIALTSALYGMVSLLSQWNSGRI
ncbi:MAG: hypothetical protein G3H99_04860 [Ferrovum sp.]|nr:hypothetical protein [Ferrovum sp.]NDU88195.1 hypothetical protein [Ferrovum sp.]